MLEWRAGRPPPPSCGAERTSDLQTWLSWSVLAGALVELFQCLGIWCGVSGGGSLAGGFGIILGCEALGGGGGAGAGARLAVGPTGGLRWVPAATVPAGRVSSAASFLHRRLEPTITRAEIRMLLFKHNFYKWKHNLDPFPHNEVEFLNLCSCKYINDVFNERYS